MITVVNKKTFKGDGIYIGRPSPLGNPFTIGPDGTRDEVIAKYEKWLPMALESKSAFLFCGKVFGLERLEEVRREFQRIKDLTEEGDVVLICWCVPERCHGDILKKMLAA